MDNKRRKRCLQKRLPPKAGGISGLPWRGLRNAAQTEPGMDRKKLDKLRNATRKVAPGQSHNPRFKKDHRTRSLPAPDRRPKPYEGVSTFLGAPLRLRGAAAGRLRGPRRGAGGRAMDLGVTNRAGARSGPPRCGQSSASAPTITCNRLAPLAETRAADVGDVPFRSRFSLEAATRTSRPSTPGSPRPAVAPVSVGGDHSITLPILKRWAPSGRSGWCTSMPTATPARRSRLQVPSRRCRSASRTGRRAGPGADHSDRIRGGAGKYLWNSPTKRHDRHPRRGIPAAGPGAP